MNISEHMSFEIPAGSKYRPTRGSKLGYNLEAFIGRTSGSLTVTGTTDKPARLHCTCSCGGTRTVEVGSWNRGFATSCGRKCTTKPSRPRGVGSNASKTAAQWAESLVAGIQKFLRKRETLALVVPEGSGFRVVSARLSTGRGRPAAVRSADDIVGYYTADVPPEHLQEDIQVFLDARAAVAATRSWERSVR
jgi:hypothetical protein